MKVLIPLAIAVIFFFQNCGNDVGFTNNVSASSVAINGDLGNGDTQDIGVINQSCETLSPQTKVINIKFPKPTKTCEWEQNGNLGIREAHFQARIEQTKSLGLPLGAVICDASFDFKPQAFRYDDYFALLFNKNVITSGYDFRSNLQAQNFGLLNYDWNSIKSIDMAFGSSKERVYCPQIPGASAECSFPGHDTAGVIDLDLDKKYIRAVMSNGIPVDHSFSLVTFGDNNELDCEHSDVEFDVTVEYVLTE